MKNLPSISIITPTWNSNIPLFERVLKELSQQEYPKNLIEHIVLDAGSTNGTPELAKKYGCNVIIREDLKMGEQVRASLGIQMAKGDLVLMLQSDNIPTSNKWLIEMVRPFLENKKVFCTLSAYNSYEKNMSAITRYGAFFGAGDPFLYYLHKSDKLPLLQEKLDKGKIINETKNYWIVEFSKENLLTMGDNGSMFLRKAIDIVNKDPKQYIHPDAFAELLDNGYNTYGIVKNSVIHVISQNALNYALRRVHVKEKYYDSQRKKRKYFVFNWNSKADRINLFKFVLFTITIVVPLYESIRGYARTRDTAWFLHPILCILMLYSYGISEVKWFLSKK